MQQTIRDRIQAITQEDIEFTLDAYFLFIDSNLDSSISQDEIIKAELTPWFDGSATTADIKSNVLSLLSKPFNPISKDYCQNCAPGFDVTNAASCSFQASSFEDLFDNDLKCIYNRQLVATARKRQLGEILGPIAIAGLLSLIVQASALPAIERSCPAEGIAGPCLNLKPINLIIEDASCRVGNYNNTNIASYFDKLLQDLHNRFRRIDFESEIFKAAFPNVEPGTAEAAVVEKCFTTILKRSSLPRPLDITINECDSGRGGASYNNNSGRFDLFGVFDSAPNVRLRLDFSKAQSTKVNDKISFMGADLSRSFSKLGVLFHEMTHRFCPTNDDLQYVNEYQNWIKSPAEKIVRNGDNYRVFYELVMSS